MKSLGADFICFAQRVFDPLAPNRITVGLLENIDDPRTGLYVSAVFNASWDAVAVASSVSLCFTADREQDFTLDDRSPLSAMRMSRKLQIL
ncbi:hypothetical protein RGQ15_21925 [Paracoccus sp. MBLB3053]|uniref:Uncharacterized protein n=1 Tax=Paracoccus aurantius TaxID=3073814 RepID=A0ABU2I0Y2_9RHOB|nr:hypothetical protein [Paracoccus sp. MBLB3053]MDS9470209.1 hypothetical protein [Paracoccus sp. MBLB3053]